MSKGAIPAQCVVCGCRFESRLKAGEIGIRMTVRGGRSMSVAGPVCGGCAKKSEDPVVALDQMRSARAHLLMSAVEVRDE